MYETHPASARGIGASRSHNAAELMTPLPTHIILMRRNCNLLLFRCTATWRRHFGDGTPKVMAACDGASKSSKSIVTPKIGLRRTDRSCEGRSDEGLTGFAQTWLPSDLLPVDPQKKGGRGKREMPNAVRVPYPLARATLVSKKWCRPHITRHSVYCIEDLR